MLDDSTSNRKVSTFSWMAFQDELEDYPSDRNPQGTVQSGLSWIHDQDFLQCGRVVGYCPCKRIAPYKRIAQCKPIASCKSIAGYCPKQFAEG